MIRKAIVSGLEVACTALDLIPTYEDGRWYRFGGWGCRLRLAARSFDLDEKWGTGVWKEPAP